MVFGFVDEIEENKAEIIQRLQLDYTRRPKNGARDSPIWKTFHLIIGEDGKEIDGFYYCLLCKEIV